MNEVDVLIGTFERPGALAVTLTSLLGQTFTGFDIVVSDQTADAWPLQSSEVQAIARVLRLRGHDVRLLSHLPRRGLAEQRAFLLGQTRARFGLFLDDDVILAPEALKRLVITLRERGCGFAGAGLIGPSFEDDERPEEQALELWRSSVEPEVVLPDGEAWQRYRAHNAANLLHIERRLGLKPDDRLAYKVAWAGGCVLYDLDKLRAAGGFDFWPLLPPEHSGEDVLAQLRVMARSGGCGVLPSGAYHQELPTTIPNRRHDAPRLLSHLIPPQPSCTEEANQ